MRETSARFVVKQGRLVGRRRIYASSPPGASPRPPSSREAVVATPHIHTTPLRALLELPLFDPLRSTDVASFCAYSLTGKAQH